jgi:hypothetical protein
MARRIWHIALPSNPKPSLPSTGVASPPVILSVTPNHGDDTGATSVTIKGKHFTGATVVKFGGTVATSFTVVDDFTITAVTPTHASGFATVLVTTPAGTGTRPMTYIFDATGGGFDPLTVAWSFALRPELGGEFDGLPWPGTTTAGTSGDNLLDVGATADPSVGTGANGYASADHNGLQYSWAYAPASARLFFSDIFTASAYYFGAWVKLRSAPAEAAQPYLNPLIIGDDGGAMGVAVSDQGVPGEVAVSGFHLDSFTVYQQTGWKEMTVDAWHWVEWWYDGTDLHIAVDGVEGASVPSTNAVVENLEHVQLGANYSGIGIDGEILEAWAAPTDMTANTTDMIAYGTARYAL